MKNVDLRLEGNTLVISIDLTHTHGKSKSGRSVVIASTQGNIPLVDGGRYREEILNLNLTRKARPEDDDD